MDNVDIFAISIWAIYIGSFCLGLLILWAVIRGAVLSALRKHTDEQTSKGPEIYRG